MKTSKWMYKAYDEKFRTHTGIETSTDFLKLALSLRQRGLQIIEAKRMNEKEIMLEERLKSMRSRFTPTKKKSASLIHRILMKMLSILGLR